MKKVWAIVMMVGLVACGNSGSTQTTADTLQRNVESKLIDSGDSVRAKGKRTLEAIKEKVRQTGNPADSVR